MNGRKKEEMGWRGEVKTMLVVGWNIGRYEANGIGRV